MLIASYGAAFSMPIGVPLGASQNTSQQFFSFAGLMFTRSLRHPMPNVLMKLGDVYRAPRSYHGLPAAGIALSRLGM